MSLTFSCILSSLSLFHSEKDVRWSLVLPESFALVLPPPAHCRHHLLEAPKPNQPIITNHLIDHVIIWSEKLLFTRFWYRYEWYAQSFYLSKDSVFGIGNTRLPLIMINTMIKTCTLYLVHNSNTMANFQDGDILSASHAFLSLRTWTAFWTSYCIPLYKH